MPPVVQVAYPISDGSETTALGGEAREFLNHRTHTLKQEYSTYGFLDWAAVFLPCIAWLRKYNVRRNLIVRTSHLLLSLYSLQFMHHWGLYVHWLINAVILDNLLNVHASGAVTPYQVTNIAPC